MLAKTAKLAGGKAYLFLFFVVKKNMKICSHLPVKLGDSRSPRSERRERVYLFPSWTSTFCGSKNALDRRGLNDTETPSKCVLN